MGVDQLRASVSAGGSYTLVVLAGESDMNTRQQLRDVLEQAMSRPARHLVIDMSGLEFIDSATVHVLIRVQGTFAGDGGQMSFVAPHRSIARVLNLTGTDQIVPVYPDLDTALAAGG
jgi:anti-sigma B factor antagonist